VAGIPQVCTVCGRESINERIQLREGAQATMINNTIGHGCPFCGGDTKIVDATYRVVGGVVRMLLHGDVKRADLDAAYEMALAMREHRQVSGAVERQVTEFSPEFAALLNSAKKNPEKLSLIVLILTLLITIYMAHSADSAAAQAHSDAQQQIAISQQQTEISQKIYDQLQQQHASLLHQAEQSKSGSSKSFVPQKSRRRHNASRRGKRDEWAWKRRRSRQP
jgi:hypothetical protein